jgi:ferric-dicitrate binding protein FerR (iron transport regulator)
MSDSPVSPEDIRAAAEVYAELGPEYHDAVVASFIEKIDREVALRVEARLAGLAAAQPPEPRRRHVLSPAMRRVRNAAAAAAAAAAIVAVVGVHHSSPAGPTSVRVVPAPVKHIRGPGGQITIVRPAAPKAPPAPPAPPG